MKREEVMNQGNSGTEHSGGVAVESPRPALAARRFRGIVHSLMLRTDVRSRWPCSYCGRESGDAPLCQIECKFENGKYAVLGCWLCNTEDIRDDARNALKEFPKSNVVAQRRGLNVSLSGVDLIAEERERQMREEGWTADHDDCHTDDSLAHAAAAYAMGGSELWNITHEYRISIWPTSWGAVENAIKSKSRLRQLVIAGALIAAEIERVQRNNVPERDAETTTTR